jgi:5-oxoprolinase (ATP-hydrolysing)
VTQPLNIWNIWIDTGGTFTDCIAQDPEGNLRYVKVLSNSSLRGSVAEIISPHKIRIDQNWGAPDNFVKGFNLKIFDRLKSAAKIHSFDANASTITFDNPHSKNISSGNAFEILSGEEAPVLACRLATGTLPDETLPPLQLRLATTKGTNALLEKKGAPTLLLITKGFGDFLRIGDQKRSDLFSFQIDKAEPLYDKVIEVPERLDAEGNVLQDLDPGSLPDSIKQFLKRENASIAISLMHSYKNNGHEHKLKQWLQKHGSRFISSSAEMSPLIKLLPRAQTTVVNAYLDPVLQDYLESVKSTLKNSSIFVMNSAAGLASSAEFKPKDSLLSGPAGGVIGAAAVGDAADEKRIISLDMGGTSTDVARYDHGFDYQFEHTVGGATIKAPALAIETVAAGGGSVCSFDGQKLTVGPDSAGADPGPACYGAGGPLTLTDINLLLGRLQPENFNIPISKQAAEEKFQLLMEQLREKEQSPSRKKILLGLLQIANERMAEAIKKISLRKGYNPAQYALVAFGGAGAQHATAIASLLNINSVLIPGKAGLLSAKGLGHASIQAFAEQQVLKTLDHIESGLSSIFQQLEKKAREKLKSQLNDIKVSVKIRRRIIFMRLEGQESTLEIEFQDIDSLRRDFKKTYRKRYGHWIRDRNIEIESMRVVAASNPEHAIGNNISESKGTPPVAYNTDVQFTTSREFTPVFRRSDLKTNHELTGPAIIIDPYSTTIIEPGWEGKIMQNGTLELTQKENTQFISSSDLSESINLELFTNRFTSIAEEMGEMMQRTALSVNVKERMDFSCALLNAKGELIVNAPHIPVHLGAMGICVRKLKDSIQMEPGDVVVTNHPHFGGSHLPDITVVTPIFDTNDDELLGYAASRAHHAEIGGTRPGSMPPDAKTLAEEGVVIPPTHLVKNEEPRWEHIKTRISEAIYPSRAVEENMADLQAAVAANHQGLQAMRQLAEDEGVDKIRHYMSALKTQTAEKAKSMIHSLPEISQKSEEFLDDGTQLCATIKKDEKTLTIDFSGTADVHPGNLNATPAIVQSVVMYVLRCLVGESIPLNEGLLDPIDIILPEGILNPDFNAEAAKCPAVVGGNTETSQRLVDLLLKPFEHIACSQGTMNNVIFGNNSFGYYETIGGGTGAGHYFDGSDAVHHHMTNTAGTDPEILEHRYPVRLERYEIRKKSGGKGNYSGGNGITRELSFLEAVSLSVLTQHRIQKPYGLQGGKPGKTGNQFIIRKDGRKESLESIDGSDLESGDRFVIHTPGGGGFGNPNSND